MPANNRIELTALRRRSSYGAFGPRAETMMKYGLVGIMLTLGFVAISAPGAQQAAKSLRVGVLASSDSIVVPPVAYALAAQLSVLGYIERKDVIVESRFAQGNEELPRLAGELAASGVDILVADGAPAVAAAAALTSPFPVVGVWAAGSAPSPRSPLRPRITGVVLQRSNRQRLEALQTLVPTLARVAAIRNLAQPDEWADVEQATRALGLELYPLSVGPSDDAAAIVRQAQAAGATAILIPDASPRAVVVPLATAAVVSLPIMFPHSFWVRAPHQGIISFGVDMAYINERVAVMVDKILKGAKPEDVPADVVSKFELVINQRRANALGLTIPLPLLQRANKIIE